MIRKVWRSFRTVGAAKTANNIRKTLFSYYWQFENEWFDKKYGVDTGGEIQTDALETDSANAKFGVRYEPTTIRTFRAIMRNFSQDLSQFTFVDYGSGKGRVLMLASQYPFRKIIGVEYARKLHDISVSNLARFRDKKQRCFDILCVHADATAYPMPPGPAVFYFYQPFAGEVMTRVLANIEASLNAAPRKIYLVFLHPHASLDPAKNLSFLDRHSARPLPIDLAWRHSRELEIYTNKKTAADLATDQ